MIEKDEFLQRARIEFAISAQLQSDRGHAIGLARRVDAEGVGLALSDASNRVG